MRFLMKWARRIVSVWRRVWQGWNIGVFAAIFNQKGEILLVCSPEDFWALPGGEVVTKDKPRSRLDGTVEGFVVALTRELDEELGVEPVKMDWRPIEVYPHFNSHDLAVTFLVQEILGEPAPRGLMVRGIGWFSPEKVPDLPFPGPRMRRMVIDGIQVFHHRPLWP